MDKELRLPDGSYTNDVDRFSSEWDKLRKPFESLGFRIVGFDPYIALCDAQTGHGHFQLPIYAAQKFIALMSSEQQGPGQDLKHLENLDDIARDACAGDFQRVDVLSKGERLYVALASGRMRELAPDDSIAYAVDRVGPAWMAHMLSVWRGSTQPKN